jgi:hypothetical protein
MKSRNVRPYKVYNIDLWSNCCVTNLAYFVIFFQKNLLSHFVGEILKGMVHSLNSLCLKMKLKFAKNVLIFLAKLKKQFYGCKLRP